MVIPKPLLEEVKRRSRPAEFAAPLAPVVEHLSSRYPGTRAVLFYGSCLERRNVYDGLVDLYVLVEDYRRAYRSRLLAVANRLLPPNVFYLAADAPRGPIRVKYAVMELDHFLRATSPRWFHSYFWGRFSQPSVILAADDEARPLVERALGQAVCTFLTRVVPVVPEEGTVKTLWQQGLRLSYQAELRPESSARLERLWLSAADYFQAVTRAAAKALPFPFALTGDRYHARVPEAVRRRERRRWRLRRLQGKGLSVLRLMKAAFTFQGGVDYALWKIERHRGLRLEVSPFFRRHPFLALLFVGWKALRAGGVR